MSHKNLAQIQDIYKKRYHHKSDASDVPRTSLAALSIPYVTIELDPENYTENNNNDLKNHNSKKNHLQPKINLSSMQTSRSMPIIPKIVHPLSIIKKPNAIKINDPEKTIVNNINRRYSKIDPSQENKTLRENPKSEQKTDDSPTKKQTSTRRRSVYALRMYTSDTSPVRRKVNDYVPI